MDDQFERRPGSGPDSLEIELENLMDDHFKRRAAPQCGCGAQWQVDGLVTSATSCRIPNHQIGRCDRNKTHLEPRLDLVLAAEPCAAQRSGLWSVQPDAAAPMFIAAPFG